MIKRISSDYHSNLRISIKIKGRAFNLAIYIKRSWVRAKYAICLSVLDILVSIQISCIMNQLLCIPSMHPATKSTANIKYKNLKVADFPKSPVIYSRLWLFEEGAWCIESGLNSIFLEGTVRDISSIWIRSKTWADGY